MNSSRIAWFARSVCLAFLLFGRLQAADAPTPTLPFRVTITGSGPPLLFIPGLACGGDVWDASVEHFRSAYQCHVFTLAGFAGQPAIKPPMLAQFRDALVRYIHEQKLTRPVIIGHSLGGFLAFWLAASIPEEVGSIISVDGAPFFPGMKDPKATAASSEPMAKILRASLQGLTPTQFAESTRSLLKGMITDPAERERIVRTSAQSDPAAVAEALYELMTLDLRESLPSIRSPVLLLGATATIGDPAEKAKAEANYGAEVAGIAHHQVVFAPKARHFIQLDEPDFFYREVEAVLGKTQ